MVQFQQQNSGIRMEDLLRLPLQEIHQQIELKLCFQYQTFGLST